MAFFDHGDVMKNLILFAALAAMLSACSTQQSNPEISNSMLSFDEIAGEITVEYNQFDEQSVADDAVVARHIESP